MEKTHLFLVRVVEAFQSADGVFLINQLIEKDVVLEVREILSNVKSAVFPELLGDAVFIFNFG